MSCHSLLHSRTPVYLFTCHGREPRVLPLIPRPYQTLLKPARPLQYLRPAYVPTDLADVGALARNLAAAGFDASRPALFTCEGIFCYLPQARL